MAVHHRPHQNIILDERPLHAGACAISQSAVRDRCNASVSNLSLLCARLDHQESTEQGRLDTLTFPSGCQTLSLHNQTWILVESRLHATLFGNQPKSKLSEAARSTRTSTAVPQSLFRLCSLQFQSGIDAMTDRS